MLSILSNVQLIKRQHAKNSRRNSKLQNHIRGGKTGELQLLTLLAKKMLHIQCPGDRVWQLLVDNIVFMIP